jgi:hypothetical protein
VADYLENLNMQYPKPSIDAGEIRKKYYSAPVPDQKPA